MRPLDSKTESFNWIIEITSTLSVISTSIVIMGFLLIPKLQRIEFFMIVMTCLGDFIASATIGIVVIYYQVNPGQIHQVHISFIIKFFILSDFKTLCVVQGIFAMFGILLSLAWTMNIAYTLSLIIQDISILQKNKNHYRMMVLIGFVLPLTLTSLYISYTLLIVSPLIFDDYKQSTIPVSYSVCFVTGGYQDWRGNTMVLGCFYVPLMYHIYSYTRLTVLFNTYCITKVVIVFRRQSLNPYLRNEISHLLLYPMILCFCWIWMLILRVIEMFDSNHMIIFSMFGFATSNLNGFFDALSYGFHSFLVVRRQEGSSDHDILLSISGNTFTPLEESPNYTLKSTLHQQELKINQHLDV